MEQGFQQSEVVVAETFHTPRVFQGYTEPHVALASFDSSGNLTLWAFVQGEFFCRLHIAHFLHIPESKIRVLSPHIGGAFGGKTECLAAPACVFPAQKARRPVKLTLTREEDFLAARPRHPSIMEMKVGARKDGTILAREARIIYDTGAYAQFGPAAIGWGCSAFAHPYRIPHVQVDGYCVYTHKIVSGAYSGFGTIQATFAFESLLDILAQEIGMDPLELRLKNAAQEGDTMATERGIAPLLILWTPMVGSKFEGHRSPTPEWHLEVTEKAVDLMGKHLPEMFTEEAIQQAPYHCTCYRCWSTGLQHDEIRRRAGGAERVLKRDRLEKEAVRPSQERV